MDQALLKSAEGGDAEAQRHLGDAYFFGTGGTAQDYARAIEWYRRAAEQGQVDSQFNLGRCYETGTGTRKNTKEAAKWYLTAASKGHAAAENNLGLCYRYGQGVAKSEAEALYWFRKSAQQGDPSGQHNLADMYLRGEGVEQNFKEAVSWFLKSAEQGDAGSQYFMGWCYQQGKGLVANTAEAVHWYSKAAKQGYGGAQAALDSIAAPSSSVQQTSQVYDVSGTEPKIVVAGASNAEGADLLLEVDKRKPDPDKAMSLIRRGAALDGHDDKGRTPLILAAWRGHEDLVRALVAAKAPLEIKDNLGNTALIFAAWQGHGKIVDLLCKAGASINERNLKGYTALICAASNGHRDVARQLIDAGADIGEKDLAYAGADAEKLQEFYDNAQNAARRREKALKKLDVLIGQKNVKERIGNFLDRMELERARASFGLPSNKLNLHTVFTGAPGTGKTTVARILGGVYKEAGLLAKGHLVETSASEILGGKYVGDGAQRIAAKIKEAQGGILFIDEAYNFAQFKSAKVDISAEAIDVILRAMGDPAVDFMMILAGYAEEIQTFLAQNQGLKSRFQTIINFDNYTPPELVEIYLRMAQEANYVLANGCRDMLERLMPMAPEKYSRTFGNARYVKNLLDETLKVLGSRIAAKPRPTREDVTTIQAEDIQKAFEALWTEPQKSTLKNRDGTPIDLPPVSSSVRPLTAPTASAFDDLDALIGLPGVKAVVKKTAYEMQFFKDRSLAGLPVGRSSRHFVFSGNPGTGKTTVARILGRILKEIGYLDQGHVVETSGYDLIGQYVGQTAPQTAARIAEAMGGILFIDEAYSLLDKGENANFSQDAISTLLKLMEDYRDKFVVIAAGYPHEMNDFLASNPGLKSRFTDHILFEDYNADDLERIYLKLAKDFKYVLADAATADLKQIMAQAPQLFAANFPNGRFVRNLFEDTIKNLAARVAPQALAAKAAGKPFGVEALTIIEREDLAEAFIHIRATASDEGREFGFHMHEKG